MCTKNTASCTTVTHNVAGRLTIVHDSLPDLLYAGSPCQLSLLAKVDSALFRVRVRCLPCTSPLQTIRFARTKECEVGTMDKDRAASLVILTGKSRPPLLPASAAASNWCGESKKVGQSLSSHVPLLW
ncbi:hypothetical protein MTO96_018286 [Rhipicephalus appendiculatus]